MQVLSSCEGLESWKRDVSTLNVKQIANDTGGEGLEDKLEQLDKRFCDLTQLLQSWELTTVRVVPRVARPTLSWI